MVVFKFFLEAAAGITLGIALVVFPCFYLYQYLSKINYRRSRQ